jgi:LEA14-like dessication related protein
MLAVLVNLEVATVALRLIWLTAPLLLLSACAGLGGYRDAVRVTVSDIQVLESTLLEQLYQVKLRIQNRSEQPLEIRGGSFDLALNGQAFGSGVTDQSLVIPAYADATLDVRMVSTVFGMLRLIQSLQAEGGPTLDYEISGRFSVADSFGGVRFDESGEIALPAGPAN